GVRISARTGWRAGDALVLANAIRRCNIGSVKAAVLPVPVWAAPMTSRPSKTTGMAWLWIGVGVVYPVVAIACKMLGCRPKSENVEISVVEVSVMEMVNASPCECRPGFDNPFILAQRGLSAP